MKINRLKFEKGDRMKRATLTIDVYERGISGQASFLVKVSRKDGGVPQTYPAESKVGVIAWVSQELKRLDMERGSDG